MSVIGSNVLAGASGSAGAAGYEITRSLRFDRAAQSYLRRTPASAGNRRTFTFSCWHEKSGVNSSNRYILFNSYTSGSVYFSLEFETEKLKVFDGGAISGGLATDGLFRDPSAWYHIVCAIDTTDGTAANRVKLYVNGVQQTLTGTQPSQNSDLGINTTTSMLVGAIDASGIYHNLDGYLADIQFIDGQALAPTDFGEYDDNNVWQPKEFVATGPNNGTTWSSGAGSNFDSANPASNGFNGDPESYTRTDNASVTATVTLPSSVPFSTLQVRGARDSGNGTIAINGVDVSSQFTSSSSTLETVTITGITSPLTSIALTGISGSAQPRFSEIIVDGVALVDGDSTNIGVNGFNLDFSDNSSNAALGTDSSGNSNTWTVNNITASAPGLETAYQGFDVVTYTGNGSTLNVTGLAFQPDLVWIKDRDSAYQHNLYDVVRGATKALESNSTSAEYTLSGLTSFNSDGFTLGSNAGNNDTGPNVAWCWKAGGNAVANTDGSITTQVSASDEYGFSVVKYTGVDNSTPKTIGHGLSSAPKFVLIKNLTDAENWAVYHTSLGNTKYLQLNGTNSAGTSSAYWNDTDPSSTVITLNNSNDVQRIGRDYVAYCWSEVSGFSKFGSYTGNGSNSGPTITTGFKPRFILIKSTTESTRNWVIFDTARDATYPNDARLSPNLSSAEATQGSIGFLYDGFQLLNGTNPGAEEINKSGQTYIYAAYAGTPAGEIVDSLIDTPTDYDDGTNVGGNYCTWNPLDNAGTLANGNLDFSQSSAAFRNVRSTFAVSSGKWYWEGTVGAIGGAAYIGIGTSAASLTVNIGAANTFGYVNDGNKQSNNTASVSYGASYTTGDVIGVAFDADAGTLTFYKNGSSQGQAYSGLTSGPYFFMVTGYNGTTWNANFGQRPFAYTPPTGYKSLCTTNLTDPTIADGSTAMDVALWSGDNTEDRLIPTSNSPGLIWIKQRNDVRVHILQDVVRGFTKGLYSNDTSTESTRNPPYGEAVSGGFEVSSTAGSNVSGRTYVGWTWDAGTSTVSNTDGSITSNVRANPSAGFSIVSWTGDRSNSTVGHGLNAGLKFLVVKNRDQGTTNWMVWHEAISGSEYISLNTTNAKATASTVWNSTIPTSSVFSLGADTESNGNTDQMIAYCFAPVEGYSAFGSYEGGSAPYVFTGFRPRWIMIKNADLAGEEWTIFDTARDTYNVAGLVLYPNTSGAEFDGSSGVNARNIDVLSNGFKINTGNPINQTGTHVYAAFAEHPFKYSRAR